MSYQDFDDHFGQVMDSDRKLFDSLSVSELVEWIKTKPIAWRFQIWHSLADRAKPQEANNCLVSFLESNAEYLDRYHCAAAFIKINQLSNYGPVMLSARNKFPVDENLQKIRSGLGMA